MCFAPLLWIICMGSNVGTPVGGLPLGVLVLLCSLPIALATYCKVRRMAEPPGGCLAVLFLLTAFISSVLWTDLLADALVSALRFVGLVIGISPSVTRRTPASCSQHLLLSPRTSEGRPAPPACRCSG